MRRFSSGPGTLERWLLERDFSTSDAVGGGRSSRRIRHRTLVIDGSDERVRAAVLEAIAAAGHAGVTLAQIAAAPQFDEARARALLAELVADGHARPLKKPAGYIAAKAADEVLDATLAYLGHSQRERPWLMGVTSLALARALAIGEPALIRVLAAFVESGALVCRNGYYATADFAPQLTAEQHAFFDSALAAGSQQVPAPIPFGSLCALIKSSSVLEVAQAFDMLVASGALSKVGDFVYRGAHIATIRAQLESALRRQGRLTVAEFRTLTATSRKYAVPLLEFFDATGVTERTGDVRILRRPAQTERS